MHKPVASRSLLVWLGAFAGAMLAGCQPPPPLNLHGTLYFEAGPYLGEFRLSTGDAMPVTNLGDWRIQRVSEFQQGELLLSVTNIVDDRRRYRIMRFDPETLHETPLIGGQAGQFLPASATLVYYAGHELVSAPRADIRGGARVVRSFGWRMPPHLVPVGNAGVLFGTPGGSVYRWDPESGTSERLDALTERCELQGAVWMADREQLVCRARDPDAMAVSLLVVDISGKLVGILPLPEKREFRAVAYLADQRILILNERRRERLTSYSAHPVWAYAMESGRLQRIARNQDLGESVVYRRHQR